MKVKVQAAAGCKCPMEPPSKRFITDQASVPVELSAYYRRLLMDGSLVRVEEAAKKTSTTASTATGTTKTSDDGGK